MKPYNTYRQTLAWVGFMTCLAALLALMYSAFLFVSAQASNSEAERQNLFYQQTANSETLP